MRLSVLEPVMLALSAAGYYGLGWVAVHALLTGGRARAVAPQPGADGVLAPGAVAGARGGRRRPRVEAPRGEAPPLHGGPRGHAALRRTLVVVVPVGSRGDGLCGGLCDGRCVASLARPLVAARRGDRVLARLSRRALSHRRPRGCRGGRGGGGVCDGQHASDVGP